MDPVNKRMNTLAIVIPAYKPDYLERALSSLAAQSFKGFTVYVGDDGSPFDLYQIVAPFEESLSIHYTRFPSNFGGKDLVKQWERCIHLCKDEEYILLFSDDDMMEPHCIESFTNLTVPDDANVLHFDINIIDENDKCLQVCPTFPQSLSAESFFDLLFRRQITARMPEFIFRRKWLVENGLVAFDLAWRSDTATVISAARSGGILTISGEQCRVLWRASGENISGKTLLARQKNTANIGFFNWLYDQHLALPMSRFYLLKTIVFALEYHGTAQFVKDGFRAAIHMKYSAGRRILTFLFILYRIPYHWMEVRRS